MPNDLPFSPAADRNRQPILEQLLGLLPDRGHLLEIAAGTGQHAQHMAPALPGWIWQPTEHTTEALSAVAERTAGLYNVAAPLRLDVTSASWPDAPPSARPERPWSACFDAVYCANLLHIAPWSACAGLMRGAARVLRPGGCLLTYGPYLEQGVATSPGNVAFDQSLRERDPGWGLRWLQDVEAEARTAGLVLDRRIAMPANNLLLVWRHRPAL
jgi:SAM-dependent methyltransferase